MKKILFLLLISLPLLGTAQKSIDKIVAKVDNNIILKSDVEQYYSRLKYEGETVTEDTKCQIFEQMVLQKMLLAKAEIDSVYVEEVMLQDQIERRMAYMEQVAGGRKRLEEQFGKTLEEIALDVKDQIREQMTAEKMQRELTDKIDVTPKEVKKFFNSIPKDSIPYIKDQIVVSHIVKYPEVTEAQKQEVIQKLLDIKQQILNGADFNALAIKYSEDPSAVQNKGEMGWQKRGNFVPEYEAAVFSMKQGEYSDIVESDFGFHLIQLQDKRGEEYRSRHILIRPQFDDNDLKFATEYLDSLKNLIEVDTISFENAAREYSNDKITSGSGGEIVNPATGNSLTLANELDSYIFLVIDTMQVGQISAPLEYRTPDGKKAMRIIYYKTKVNSHYLSLKNDYDKIYGLAKNQKKAFFMRDVIKKLKGEVYINIDKEFQKCKILQQLE